MKYIIFILISLSALFIISCDQIDPYVSKRQLFLDTSINDPNYLDTFYIKSDTTSKNLKRNAFLIEFTGYRCGQCPPAAELAHKYKEENENKIFLMSIHSGGFAKPLQAHFVDFQNSDADLLYNICGASNNPAAALNYKKYAGSNTIVTDFTKSNLDPKISEILDQNADMSLDLKLHKSAYKYIINANVSYLKDMINQQDNIALYVVEDSIVTWQLDYRILTDNSWVDNYVHNGVFRGSIDGVLGKPLAIGDVKKGSNYVKSFVYYFDTKKTNINKLRFIACVLDKTTYEVKQVEEIKVLK
jgi:hypothetical protein